MSAENGESDGGDVLPTDVDRILEEVIGKQKEQEERGRRK